MKVLLRRHLALAFFFVMALLVLAGNAFAAYGTSTTRTTTSTPRTSTPSVRTTTTTRTVTTSSTPRPQSQRTTTPQRTAVPRTTVAPNQELTDAQKKVIEHRRAIERRNARIRAQRVAQQRRIARNRLIQQRANMSPRRLPRSANLINGAPGCTVQMWRLHHPNCDRYNMYGSASSGYYLASQPHKSGGSHNWGKIVFWIILGLLVIAMIGLVIFVIRRENA